MPTASSRGKEHLGTALAHFFMNLASPDPESKIWLRLTMVNLEGVLLPKHARNEKYTPTDLEVERLTADDLCT